MVVVSPHSQRLLSAGIASSYQLLPNPHFTWPKTGKPSVTYRLPDEGDAPPDCKVSRLGSKRYCSVRSSQLGSLLSGVLAQQSWTHPKTQKTHRLPFRMDMHQMAQGLLLLLRSHFRLSCHLTCPLHVHHPEIRQSWSQSPFPSTIRYFSVYGTGQLTPHTVTFEERAVGKGGEAELLGQEHVFSFVDGDGTVPTDSALADDLPASERVSVEADHVVLLRHDHTLNTVREWLGQPCRWSSPLPPPFLSLTAAVTLSPFVLCVGGGIMVCACVRACSCSCIPSRGRLDGQWHSSWGIVTVQQQGHDITVSASDEDFLLEGQGKLLHGRVSGEVLPLLSADISPSPPPGTCETFLSASLSPPVSLSLCLCLSASVRACVPMCVLLCLCRVQLTGQAEGTFSLTLMDGSCTTGKLEWQHPFATSAGPFSLSLTLQPSSRCAGERRACAVPHGRGHTFCPGDQSATHCLIDSCDPGHSLQTHPSDLRSSGGCVPCPPGTFKVSPGLHRCTPCPRGDQEHPSSPATTVRTLRAGAVSEREGCARVCAPGHELRGGGARCVPCSPGFYKETAGPGPCRRCGSTGPAMSAFFTGVGGTSRHCPSLSLSDVLASPGSGHWTVLLLGVCVGVLATLCGWRMFLWWRHRLAAGKGASSLRFGLLSPAKEPKRGV